MPPRDVVRDAQRSIDDDIVKGGRSDSSQRKEETWIKAMIGCDRRTKEQTLRKSWKTWKMFESASQLLERVLWRKLLGVCGCELSVQYGMTRIGRHKDKHVKKQQKHYSSIPFNFRYYLFDSSNNITYNVISSYSRMTVQESLITEPCPVSDDYPPGFHGNCLGRVSVFPRLACCDFKTTVQPFI